jgi:flagellar FliL protein
MNVLSPPEAEGDATVEEELSNDPPLYTSLHPPLVVNFKDVVGDSHFMQITMEVMSRDQSVINSVREHAPAIRNSLILLFSGAVYEEVTTREGKEQMLADGLVEIQKVMAETTGETGVEAVYFTSLVIQ